MMSVATHTVRVSGWPPFDERFLGVPILASGQPYGNLYLTEKEDMAGEFHRAR